MPDNMDIISKELVEEARELKCSEVLINNFLVAGDFNSACELEEEVRDTKAYLAREATRKGYINYNAIAKEAAKEAVSEFNRGVCIHF